MSAIHPDSRLGSYRFPLRRYRVFRNLSTQLHARARRYVESQLLADQPALITINKIFSVSQQIYHIERHAQNSEFQSLFDSL